MPPRVPVGSMGCADRPDTRWDLTVPSRPAVAPAARTLALFTHMSTTTTSSPEHATALWCRLHRFGPSLSTRTKRPATSDDAGEHGVQVSHGCARAGQKKWPAGLGSRAAIGSHRGRRASMAPGRAVWTWSACTRAPSGSARPSRARSCWCLSFMQRRRPTRCS